MPRRRILLKGLIKVWEKKYRRAKVKIKEKIKEKYKLN